MDSVGDELYPPPPQFDAFEWWVVFSPDKIIHAAGLPWWNLVLAVDWRHCWAMKNDGIVWTAVTQNAYGMEVETLGYGPEHDVPGLLAAGGCRVLHVTGERRVSYLGRGLLTCVSVVKQLVGMRAWTVITPAQLYRRLIRDGAEVIHGRRRTESDSRAETAAA